MSDQPRGFHTHNEILSQPEAWQAALEVIQDHTNELSEVYAEGRYDSLIFTGCGSTYYLALAAAALIQEQVGVPARALPASEIWLYPRSSYLPKRRYLLVAVSRSGATTETLRAVEAFKANHAGDVLTISCYPEAKLAQMGSLNLVLPSGQETSVAQTRAFSVLYLATAALAALWSKQDKVTAELGKLPEVGRKLLNTYADLATRLGQQRNIERFYFLGSGARYGLAAELSLKMKEISLSHSEPFHFMEFRHGPQSMVTSDTLMVGLVSEANRQQELAVLNEMRGRGAQILGISENDTEIAFESSVSEAARNVLYLPIGQLLGYERSLDRGLNPDRPNNLEAVVRLEQ